MNRRESINFHMLLNQNVEIAPHYDLWMLGAQHAKVVDVNGSVATLRMHNTAVKKLQYIPVADVHIHGVARPCHPTCERCRQWSIDNAG